jgi:hypothetical protein
MHGQTCIVWAHLTPFPPPPQGRARVGWHVDPFGHSASIASLWSGQPPLSPPPLRARQSSDCCRSPNCRYIFFVILCRKYTGVRGKDAAAPPARSGMGFDAFGLERINQDEKDRRKASQAPPPPHRALLTRTHMCTHVTNRLATQLRFPPREIHRAGPELARRGPALWLRIPMGGQNVARNFGQPCAVLRRAGARVRLAQPGLGRVVALHCRSCTLYQTR